MDFSGACGAPLLLVGVGPSFRKGKDIQGKRGATAKATTLAAGGTTFDLLTLQKGPAPVPRAADGKVAIGRQTVAFDGQKLILRPTASD